MRKTRALWWLPSTLYLRVCVFVCVDANVEEAHISTCVHVRMNERTRTRTSGVPTKREGYLIVLCVCRPLVMYANAFVWCVHGTLLPRGKH